MVGTMAGITHSITGTDHIIVGVGIGVHIGVGTHIGAGTSPSIGAIRILITTITTHHIIDHHIIDHHTTAV